MTYAQWNEFPGNLGPEDEQEGLFLPRIAPNQGFTAVLLTYDRVEALFKSIKVLGDVKSLAKVVVVWNNPKKAPPTGVKWPKIAQPIEVLTMKQNKLGNRFIPFKAIRTEAVLSLDDDIVQMLNADEIEFGYQVWREYSSYLVGFPSRVHILDPLTRNFVYNSEWTNNVSMILTGAAFYHKYYGYLYTKKLPIEIRRWIDEKMNCEDIAMNFLIAFYTGQPAIKIWSETDYRDIRVAVKSVLPYGHYFHSGFTGSGVCVFSRERIEDSLMHRYSLNGFAHHVHRGDWFGGKVIGMVRVSFKKFAVNFYTTHIHAEYDRVNDLYLAHRVVQSFEMSQFVKTTSRSADIVVVTGDLNLEPEDLGYRLIISNAGLKDAWVIRENQKSEDFDFGYTCDRPSNSYSKEATLSRWPLGKRIDYILFHAGQCVQREKDGETEALQPLLEKSVVVVSEAQRRVSSDRRFFYLALFGLSVVLLYTLNMEISVAGLTVVAMGLRFMVTIIIAFCLWYGLVGLTLEEKALKAAKAGMMKLLGKDPLDDFLQAV